ncbi:MAG: DUF3105 domain-containing protein [Dehalococcoidia bacterium]|nr:DUF3105 domain-containing protein [Dehalococcoidia bacterium]
MKMFSRKKEEAVIVPARVATQRPEDHRGMSKTDLREIKRERSRGRKGRRRMLITVGAAIFAGTFIAGLVLPGVFDSRQNTRAGLNKGGPVSIAEDEGREHVAAGQSHAPYMTKPATSGDHWFTPPVTLAPYGAPARWGIYDEVLPDEVLIHNLEHGGIGMHYDCPDGCDDLVNRIKDLVTTSKSQFIVSPYLGMPKKIAITAWRHVMYMDAFDQEKIIEFIREYQDRAPESLPNNQF